MRLKPGLPAEEIYDALAARAVLTWGEGEAARMASNLRQIAGFMADIGGFEVPDDVEAFFSSDSARGGG
jgi:hypothetical protein